MLDGLSDWMARKKLATLDEVRGSGPSGTDEAPRLLCYVRTMRAANNLYGLR